MVFILNLICMVNLSFYIISIRLHNKRIRQIAIILFCYDNARFCDRLLSFYKPRFAIIKVPGI